MNSVLKRSYNVCVTVTYIWRHSSVPSVCLAFRMYVLRSVSGSLTYMIYAYRCLTILNMFKHRTYA